MKFISGHLYVPRERPLVSVTGDFEDHLYLAFLPPTDSFSRATVGRGVAGPGEARTMKGKKELCSLSTLQLVTRSHRFNWPPNYTQRSAVTLGNGRPGLSASAADRFRSVIFAFPEARTRAHHVRYVILLRK